MLRKIFIVLALAASAFGQARLGEVQAGDASIRGSAIVVPGGVVLMSGAEIAAGANPATLKLDRGGEIRVCTGSNITVTSDPTGHDMMIALGGGSLETHYTLPSNSDSVMTPDFRILLPGPGDFHLAINVNQRGDTCVQSLPKNSASVIVTEMMGDASYQVRTGEAVLFHAGHVDGATPSTATCGCPPPPPATVKKELGFPEDASKQAAAAIAVGQPPPPTEPLVPESELKPGQAVTQVDVPFVFHGEDAPPPSPDAVRKSIAAASLPNFIIPKPLPPPKEHKRHWFQKMFGGLFG